jgi:hypothetical protein
MKKIASELLKLAKEVMAEEALPDFKGMKITEIGSYIEKSWRPPNYAAKPYLDAMQQIDVQGNYILDDWTSVVAYFLSNATSWRGPVAKAVKAELNRRLKTKKMNG